MMSKQLEKDSSSAELQEINSGLLDNRSTELNKKLKTCQGSFKKSDFY